MYTVKYRDFAMSCAEMAGLIQTQLGMLGRVGPGNMYYMGYRCPHGGGTLWGVWAIEKHSKA